MGFFPARNSLAFRLPAVVLFALLLFSVFLGIQAWITGRNEAVLQMDRRGEALATAAVAFCVEPMLTRDYPLLETYANSLVKGQEAISFVRFIREDGITVASHSLPDFSDGDPLKGTRYYRREMLPSGSGSTAIGEVVLGIDSGPDLARANREAWFLMLRLAVLTFIAAVTLGWLLRRLFLIRLLSLNDEALRLGDGSLDEELAVLGDDELGHLRDGLESMRGQVRSSLAALEERNVMLQGTLTELELALREAEEANRCKSDFLAMMSHEIRTPLNGVIGATTLLENTELKDDQVKFTGIIQEAGKSLLSVISDILDFSKVEAGRMDLRDEPYSPEQLARSVAAVFTPQAEAKGLEFNLQFGPDLPGRLLGDSDRMRQVLVNLIGNAVKFTDRGGVTLSLAKGEEATLRWAVHDTGLGIERDALEKLFEPFTQAEQVMTRSKGGTGLGLSISARLVELMGGKISVRSRIEEGSSFTVTLPYRTPSPEFVQAGPQGAPAPPEFPRGR